jgi:hypothetical protein
LGLLSACWPSRIGMIDGSMPEEWKAFYVTTLENDAPNAPLSYSVDLSESLKDGIQNNTRLALATQLKDAQVQIEGAVVNYSVSPIALQEGDNAAQNRLSITARFTIFLSTEEEAWNLTSTRFVDYASSQDLSSVEATLLEEINVQIVQDVINKLRSNW